MQAIWQHRLDRANQLAKVSPVAPDVLDFYRHIATFQAALAGGAQPASLHLLESLAHGNSGDPLHAFYRRVLRQAECVPPHAERCRPVAVLLRDGRRSLLCGVCFHQWEQAGAGCLSCGEPTSTILPEDTAKEFPHIALETCNVCRTYLKVIGGGNAAPEVDELASVTVDLWAAAHGFTKLQTNLFGI